MFIFTHPVYPRRPWERIFKQVYNFGLVLNFAAFIITYTDFHMRLNNTYDSYWADTDFHLYPPLTEILRGCNFTGSLKVNSIHTPTAITYESMPFLFVVYTAAMFGVFAMHAILIFFDFWAKFCYALNIRNLRYKGLYLRINIILLLLVVVLSVTVIAIIAATDEPRKLLKEYVGDCASKYILTSEDKFIAAEHDVEVIFGNNMNFILAATIINFFFYMCGSIHLIGYALKEKNGRIQALKHPWEKGFFCQPNKPLLIKFCKERRMIEEHVMTPGFLENQKEMERAQTMEDAGQPTGDEPQEDEMYLAQEEDQMEEEMMEEGAEEPQEEPEEERKERHRKKRKHRHDEKKKKRHSSTYDKENDDPAVVQM